MTTTCKEFKFYTNAQAIQYVGWLLACDAESNISKGERLINALHTEEDRTAAKEHALYLTKLYNEG